MKTKLLLLLGIGTCVLAFLLWPRVEAQVPTSVPYTLFTGGSCAATTSVTRNLVIDCSKQANVGVQITQANGDSGVSNVVYNFTRSVDGAQYDTDGFSVTVPSNGTNVVSVVTNLASCGANYIKLTTITNKNSATFVTNISVAYGIKISSP